MKEKYVLTRAKKYCENNKLRFTEPRKKVLSLLANTHSPFGAYKIKNLLSSGKEQPNPPTIYRAIEFWEKHGFIHRVESLNAYIVCCQNHQHENFCIFICDNCNITKELCLKDNLISTNNFKENGFTAHSYTTEIRGKCSKCI